MEQLLCKKHKKPLRNFLIQSQSFYTSRVSYWIFNETFSHFYRYQEYSFFSSQNLWNLLSNSGSVVTRSGCNSTETFRMVLIPPFCFISYYYFVYLTMIYLQIMVAPYVCCLSICQELTERNINKGVKYKIAKSLKETNTQMPSAFPEKNSWRICWQTQTTAKNSNVKSRLIFCLFWFYFEYLSTSFNTYLALEHYLVSSYQAGMYHLRNSYVIYLLSKSDDLLTLYLNILVARPWATNHVYCDSYTLLKGGQSFSEVSLTF